jgi:serine protease Do
VALLAIALLVGALGFFGRGNRPGGAQSRTSILNDWVLGPGSLHRQQPGRGTASENSHDAGPDAKQGPSSPEASVTITVPGGSPQSEKAGRIDAASSSEVDAFLSAAMERLERQVAVAVAYARESVVALEYSAADAPTGTRRIATGVVINERGEVLSVKIDPVTSGSEPPRAGNNSTPILARDHLGRSHIAHWLAADPDTGLTLLQIGPRILRAIRMAPDGPNLGGQIFVLGNPFGMGQSVSRGHIAGLNSAMELADRQLGEMIQIQAPLYPGDSGAAVVDVRGELLGFVRSGLAVRGFRGTPRSSSDRRAAEATSSVGSSQSPSGARADTPPDQLDQAERDNDFGFAIPACDALWVAEQLHACGRVDRAYLGVRLEGVSDDFVVPRSAPPASAEKANASAQGSVAGIARQSSSDRRAESHGRGVLVEVLAGTPAAEAGLRTGDRIISVDGRPIRSAHDLTDRLDRILARTTIQLGVIRTHGSRREKIFLSLRTASRPSRHQVAQVESTTAEPAHASSGSSTPTPAAVVTTTPPVSPPAPISVPAPTPAPAAPEASTAFSGAPGKAESPLNALPPRSAPLGEQPATAPAPGLRQNDLQLTLPRAVVERLEQLERRLEKLESPAGGAKSLSAKQATQIGSVRNP